MKIDIHTHTKKCKSGDAPTREISPEKFCEAIQATDVKIVAITNHNVFDLTQFVEITSKISKEVQVWPGIELDVLEDGERAHLLVIVSPLHAKKFSKLVEELTKDSSPETFSTSIAVLVAKFDTLDPLYVAHYKQKKPDLSDQAIDKLVAQTKNPTCVLKEVTNSISAGIFISHGHASIYGSDVHDWSEYEELARQLPDLRLEVDSFEHFRLLLQKDQVTINTLLDKKTPEELLLTLFDGSLILKLKVYNDINIVFGPKGTGKTCILRAIAKHYVGNGIDANVYEANHKSLADSYDIKGKELKVNLSEFDIDNCAEKIDALRSAEEVLFTPLSRYVAHYKATHSNKNANRILLKNIEPEDSLLAKREFEGFHDAVLQTDAYLSFLTSSSVVKLELGELEHSQIIKTLSDLLGRLKKRSWASFSNWKEVSLLNSSIKFFSAETEKKSGMPAKPTWTGFRDYALNRVRVFANAGGIIKSVEKTFPPSKQIVGSLGPNKGELELITEIAFQTGYVTDVLFHPIGQVKKGALKEFIKGVRKIHAQAFADDLFSEIGALNSNEDLDGLVSVSDLLLFKRYFALKGKRYDPSGGEESMVMLHTELQTDKDVYILDEPEKSLGNEYISDVIVPLIRERARAGKRIFISTHDANIAVRTLPYSSLYRVHEPDCYKTYAGNPFSNKLVNLQDDSDRLDWKAVSMRTLEGGEAAFGERGKIYGN